MDLDLILATCTIDAEFADTLLDRCPSLLYDADEDVSDDELSEDDRYEDE